MATEAPPVSPPPSSTEDAPPTKPEQTAPETPEPVELKHKTDPTTDPSPSPEADASSAVVTTRETASSLPEEGAVEAAAEESATLEGSKQETAQVKEGEKDGERAEEENPSPSIVESTAESDKSSELKNTTDDGDKKKRVSIQPAVSFKEESYFVTDLSDSERKSLEELKKVVQEAVNNNTLCPPPVAPEQSSSTTALQPESDPEKNSTIESALKQDQEQQQLSEPPQISIWGIPILKDERTDVILLKFLRAREFRVTEAFAMIKRTLQWRVRFGIDQLLEEDLGDDLEKVVFMHGHDREGHPVCYNVYGEFQNKELYQKTFADEKKRRRFLRWRIQFLEKSIRKLDFRPGGVNTIFQVNDLKNAPGPGKRELRQATRQGLSLLQDNYPEFVAKQVFINVPWWYVAFYTMMSPFMTQRTKSKFVFVGPAKTADTLFKYISPEQVPIQYGGLSVDFCDCNPEFNVDDPATELLVKPTTKQFVEILVSEKCVIVWELRVVGWDVTYSAEFIPSSKDKYTVVIQKATKMSSSDDPVVSGSFKISDLGKIVLTVDNPTFKKRKLVYRYKVLPYPE